VVVATPQADGDAMAPSRVLRPAEFAETRRLAFGAAVAMLPRRIPGGFPIKLLNYMKAGREVLAGGDRS
jgi:hypothetical protein